MSTGEQRHPWMDRWCAGLARVIAGRDAQRWLDAGVELDAALVVLPSWAWQAPRIDVGAKDRVRGGSGRLLLPVRVSWDSSCVVVTDCDREVLWQANGLGCEESGSTAIRVSGSGFAATVVEDPDASIVAPVLDAATLTRELAALAHDGEVARWELVSGLEGYVERAVLQAHAYLSKDVAGNADAPALLDEVALAGVRDELMFGSSRVASTPLRLIDLSTAPTAFAKVDPQRYVSRAVVRDAQDAVRRAVGDPHVGSRVRAAARELGLSAPYGQADVDAVVAFLEREAPDQRIRRGRVERALQTGPVPEALGVGMDSEGGRAWF